MIVTRGLGRSLVRSAIVAAGLCIGFSVAPSFYLPIPANIQFVSAEVRFISLEETVEMRTVVVPAESRTALVTEVARLAVVSPEIRIVFVTV